MSREDFLFMAKCSAEAERYEETVGHMKALAMLHAEFTTDERETFQLAYRNFFGARRESWKSMSAAINVHQAEFQQESTLDMATTYKSKVGQEVCQLAQETIDLISEHILPFNESSAENSVFFWKMKADCCRFKAEVLSHEEENADARSAAGKEADEAYQEAMQRSQKLLSPANPIRLRLVLNYSVFKYEITQEPEVAKSLAHDAFAAMEDSGDPEEEYKNATLVMQLLKDNLTLWTQEEEEEEEEVGEGKDASSVVVDIGETDGIHLEDAED